MENIALRLLAWCYQHTLTTIMVVALTVGLVASSFVNEEPVYQGDYWVHCGANMPIAVRAYHFENKFYYEDLGGERVEVKLSRCTITKA